MKILKILTLISYPFIMLMGEKVGGPLMMFVVLDLWSAVPIDVVASVMVLAAIICWILLIVQQRVQHDKILVPVLATVLSIPVVRHMVYLSEHSSSVSNSAVILFVVTALIYCTLLGLLLFKLFKPLTVTSR